MILFCLQQGKRIPGEFVKMSVTIQNEVATMTVCLHVPLKCYYGITLPVSIDGYIDKTYKLLKQQPAF